MAAKIFRINYKSDFILTLNSDAGWMTPFCIKFWTGAPSQAYFVGWDGTTYTHCAYDPSEPTKLLVQFDDHHLPIGDLKFQIAYHFTVADFPNDTEDEVINPANITTEIDGETYQVMLDFTGETAPEIEFSLPAYANEAQRIANEQQRIAHEAIRIVNEESRIAAETIRQQNEAQRIAQETARVNEFATLKSQSQAATRDANDAATLANQKAQLAQDKADLAQAAATLANQKAQLAADKAALANAAAQLANEKAALAQQKAEYAQTQGGYAKDQGDYAKAQGDTALADHQRAEADHGIAVDDHTQAGNDHTRAESDHGIAVDDHTQAGNDHTRAESDHGIAADDHTQAGNDHTRAESDHTRAESDHAAVEVYVDSLGAFDISAYHATGGVLAEYADLTAALGTNGANIPDALRKGGMSVKFVQSSDHKYVQYRLMADTFNTTVANWERYNDVTTSNQSFSDLDISDEQGNVLTMFSNGHIKTKNFDSSEDATELKRGLMSANDKAKLNTIEQGADVNDVITTDSHEDLNVKDENGKVLIQCEDGEIRTKNFNSSTTPNILRNSETADLDISDEHGNVLMQIKDGHIKTKNFNSKHPLPVSDNIIDLNNETSTTQLLQSLNKPGRVTYDNGGTFVSLTKPFLIVHFSDIHADSVNLSRIKDFYTHYSTYITDVIHTGDSLLQKLSDDYTFWHTSGADSFLNVTGNHDVSVNTGGMDLSAPQTDVYNKIFKPYISLWNVTQPANAETEGLMYYYKDYATEKVRLIVVDMFHLDSAQKTWFQDRLDECLVNGYTIIAAAHFGLWDTDAIDCSFNTCDLRAGVNPDYRDANEPLATMIDTYINDGGLFACWIAGHTHADWFRISSLHPRQVCINVTTSKNAGSIGDFSVGEYCSDDRRINGEKSQDAFNIFSVDTSTHCLRVLRIGSDKDRMGRSRHILVYDYSSMKVIWNN